MFDRNENLTQASILGSNIAIQALKYKSFANFRLKAKQQILEIFHVLIDKFSSFRLRPEYVELKSISRVVVFEIYN